MKDYEIEKTWKDIERLWHKFSILKGNKKTKIVEVLKQLMVFEGD